MTTRQELESKVRADGTITERLQKIDGMIGAMCKEGRPPRLSIPVQWYDEDFYILTTIKDVMAENARLSAAEETHARTIEKLREQLAESVSVIESLTPGGSEFSGDVDRCAEWIRERLGSVTRQVIKRKEIQADYERLTDQLAQAEDCINELLFVNDGQRETIERLREALRPFAKAFPFDVNHVTIGSYKKAAEVMEGTE